MRMSVVCCVTCPHKASLYIGLVITGDTVNSKEGRYFQTELVGQLFVFVNKGQMLSFIQYTEHHMQSSTTSRSSNNIISNTTNATGAVIATPTAMSS